MITWAGGGGSGPGGSGGGGPGQSASGTPGTANTGGGGGGGGDNPGGPGGIGGSGIVIVCYADTFDDISNVSAGLTSNGSAGNTTPDTSRANHKFYKFTAGTGTIKF
jgi:hypothetical protein